MADKTKHNFSAPIHQRVFALLMLGGVLVLLVQFALMPAITVYRTNAAQLVVLQDQYFTLRNDAAPKHQVFLTAEQLVKDDRFSHGLLPPSTPHLSISAVKARARRCIQNAGGSILEVAPYPTSPNGVLTAFGVSITARLTPTQFDNALAQFEMGQPALFIRAIDIQTLAAQSAGGNSGSPHDRRYQTYRIDVVGLGSSAMQN